MSSINPPRHEAAAARFGLPARFRCVEVVLTEDPQSTWLGDFRPLILANQLATDAAVEQGAMLRAGNPVMRDIKSQARYTIYASGALDSTHDVLLRSTTKRLSASNIGEDVMQIRSGHFLSPASWLPEAHNWGIDGMDYSGDRSCRPQNCSSAELCPTSTNTCDGHSGHGHTQTSISIDMYSRRDHWGTCV